MLDDIGSGRFGPVYRAQDDPANPAVAVKVFDQGLSPGQAALLAEALTRLCQAPLDHASIVRPIAAGAEAELAWLAETDVDGMPLDHVMRQVGPQPLADVLLRLTQVAGALDFAAAVGVYHGALHPHDILVAGDRTFVTGLGVVQALADAGLDVPTEGATISPQRALGLTPSHADDIFSLAAITYEVVYGRPLDRRAKLPTVVTPITGVDRTRLLEVLEGTLADDPLERPGSALEFAAALQRVLIEADMPIRDAQRQGSDSDSDPDSAIPVPIQIPILDSVDDLPLRTELERGSPGSRTQKEFTELGELDVRPDLPNLPVNSGDQLKRAEGLESAPKSTMLESVSALESESGRQNRESRPESRDRVSWPAIAAALVIGLLMGFAGGFIVGQRDSTPAPRRAERAVPRAQRDAAPAPNAPAPPIGQDFTESTVPPTPLTEPDVKPTEPVEQSARSDRSAPAERERVERTEPAERPERSERDRSESERSERSELHVVSRPAGAQVFVDGRLVGTTPLVLPAVTPGAHAVRIALPGHQRWVTTVDLAAGSRARVAASLER